MNKAHRVQYWLSRAGIASPNTDGILAPITSLASDLRARQAKCYDDAAGIERQIKELTERYNSTMNEGDRAGRVATQLEEVTL